VRAAYRRAIDAGLTKSQAQRYSDYYRRKTVLPKRDSEKTKTYNAEWKLENEHPELIGPLNEFKDVEKFVKQVTASKTWEKVSRYHGKVRVVQSRNMGSRAAYMGKSHGSWIEISPAFDFNKYIVLHELAHSAGHSHHHVTFRQTLLKLVSRFLGRETAAILKANFKEQGLRVTPSKAKDPECVVASLRDAHACCMNNQWHITK
jgi:putative metallohydrolase (TIGR04338 family)